MVLVMATASQAGISPTKVAGGPADQSRPTSDGASVAWTEFKRSTGNDVFVRTLGTTTERRVNEAGTAAWLGSFAGAMDEIVYQQATRRRSDIYTYDVSDRTRSKLRGGVSSPDWEWRPVASAELVLFLRDVLNARGDYVKTKLMMVNRATDAARTLIDDIGRRAVVFPGFAGSGLVAWTRCARTCNVYIHDAIGNTTSRLPLPDDRAQYAPAIDEAGGVIYFIRSGLRCGQGVTFRSASLADPSTSTAVFGLPPGIDTDWTMSLATDPDTMLLDLYFGRFHCARQDTDVYVLKGVDALMPTVRSRGQMGVSAGGGSRRTDVADASPGHPKVRLER
jgi:hypothetical protein